MNEETAKTLQAPFPDELISKLPKITCKACSDSRTKNCEKHQKSKCNGCGSYITSAHLHLDYVGHAETTDRLLKADPEWTWEPVAFGPDGLPKLDAQGGLWMRLTVGGVTRLGYGDAQGKTGPNAVKEAIGDGIRNAAMRFGVALDLWAKSDLAAVHADKETGEIAGPAPRQAAPPAPDPEAPAEPAALRPKQQLWAFAQSKGMSADQMGSEFESWAKAPLNASTPDDKVLDFLAVLVADFESRDAA